jgi:hypothetical protein
MGMNKTIGLLIAFVFVMIIGMYAVSFTSTVQAPDANTTAGQQYDNLSSTIGIANSGINAVMLLLILGMVISAIIIMITISKRH